MTAAIFLPSSRALRAASSQPGHVDLVLRDGRHGDEVAGAEAEPAGDVGGAVVPGIRYQDHRLLGHAVGDGVRTGLLQPHLHAVQGGAGAAEREHAAGPFLIVADQPGGDARGFHLGQRHQPAVLVPRDVGVVQRGQQDPDDAGDGGRRHDVDLRVGVAEYGHSLQVAHQVGRHRLHRRWTVRQFRLARRFEVTRLQRTEKRQVRLERIHLVEGAHDGVDKVRIVDGGSDTGWGNASRTLSRMSRYGVAM